MCRNISGEAAGVQGKFEIDHNWEGKGKLLFTFRLIIKSNKNFKLADFVGYHVFLGNCNTYD